MKAMSLVQRTTALGIARPAHPLFNNICYVGRNVVADEVRTFKTSRISFAARTSNVTAPEHTTFIKEVAAAEPPSSLRSLLSVLQAKGERIVSPYNRKGILPLAIPLSENQEGDLTALLRWPTPAADMDMPVVRVQSFGVTLLAKSPEEYIHRALVEEDAAPETSSNIEDSAGEVGSSLYKKGDYGASKLSNLEVYLMKKVGLFPDVFEKLALRHLEKGDSVSALVTGEYYASKRHFPGFGRPFVFNAELMFKVGRRSEAKDAARIALKSPWWTLGSSYTDVATMAGWGEEQIEFMRERVTEEGRREDLLKGKTPEQVAVDQAAFLLDLAAVKGSWDDVRDQLASYYKEGGLEEISRFISTA